MQIEQRRDVIGRDPTHPALGADAPILAAQGGIDVLLLRRGRALRLIAGVVRDEGEIELGLRAGLQVVQRGEVLGVVAGLRAIAGASAVETTDTEYTQIFTGVLASGAV